MVTLANRKPDGWARDLEVVEAIASTVDTDGVGWFAERALRHAEVGGPGWRRVVVETLGDDLLEFDDERVRNAAWSASRQQLPLGSDVLAALSQRLRWACQDRDRDDAELVRLMVRVLVAHPKVYSELRTSLNPIEIKWLDACLRG